MPAPLAERAGAHRVVSLFTGMGGMDLGRRAVTVHRASLADDAFVDGPAAVDGFVRLRRQPFEVVFQIDTLREAWEVASRNGWATDQYRVQDIREALADPQVVLPDADVVIGGFPCQDFSRSGRQRGFANAERGTLYQCFVEVVRRVRPRVFVAENVANLANLPGVLERIVADFADAGYRVSHQLVRCEDHGVPQRRSRLLITGARRDLALPEGWHALAACNRVTCPIGPYLAHLREPEDTDDDAQRVYSKAAKLARGQGQAEIDPQRPAPTMRAEHHGNIEFRRRADGRDPALPERRLTLREAALIQTFPPDCVLTSPRRLTQNAYKPIGNAVPPLLAYLVADRVRRALDDDAPNAETGPRTKRPRRA